MSNTAAASATYEVKDGQAHRVYSAAEILDALRAILPSSESHVESLTYCWQGLGGEEAKTVEHWQHTLRRAYEVAGVEPPPHSVLRGGHTGDDCTCTPPQPAAEGE